MFFFMLFAEMKNDHSGKRRCHTNAVAEPLASHMRRYATPKRQSPTPISLSFVPTCTPRGFGEHAAGGIEHGPPQAKARRRRRGAGAEPLLRGGWNGHHRKAQKSRSQQTDHPGCLNYSSVQTRNGNEKCKREMEMEREIATRNGNIFLSGTS